MQSDLLWILFGRVVTALLSIASLRVMTTLLEPNDYGIYTLLVAFQGLCGLLLINPVGQHINRHTHSWWDDGTLLQRLRAYNRYIIAVSTGIATVVVVWWCLYPGTDQSLVGALLSALAVSAVVYLGTWNGTVVYILNMLGFRSASVRWMLSTSIVGLLFSMLFTYNFHSGTSWLLGQAVGMAVGALGAGLMLRNNHSVRKFPNSPDATDAPLLNKQTIVSYCLPLAMATGLMWLQSTGYRFWVGGTWGAAELGLLAVGLSISAQIWATIETLSIQFLNPYFFRHITSVKSDAQKSVILSDMVNVIWPIYAVLAGFNMIFASSLLMVLTNERYHGAVTFVLFGVLIEFARCTANLWSYAAQIEQSTTKYISPYGVGAIVVWAGAIAVTYVQGGIVFMAIVLAISGLVMCVVMLLVMQRMIPVKLDIWRWGAGSGMLLACMVSAIFIPLRVQGFATNILAIIFGLLFSGGAMLALLWRNPALLRLLAVNLRRT